MRPKAGCHGTDPHRLRRLGLQSSLRGSFFPQSFLNAIIRISGQCLLLNLYRFRFIAGLRENL